MRCQQRKATGYSKRSSHVREPDQAPPAAAGREGGETYRSKGQAGLVSLEDRRSPGSGRPGFRREAELGRGLGWALDEDALKRGGS